MRRLAAFAALCLASAALPAHATVTKTLVGSGTCVTAAASCTGNFTTTVAAGSIVEIEITVGGLAQSYVFSITDSGGNAYGGAGSGASNKTTLNSANNASLVMGYTLSTTAGLTSASTFTVTTSVSTFTYVMQAFVLTGVSRIGSVGASVNGTWTSGSPNTFATTPTLGYSSEYADAIIGGLGNTADTMGTYANGFAAVSSITTSSSNRGVMFISGQTVTSGTATLVATPTSSAGRVYSSIIIYWVVTGAVKIGCGGCSGLLGV
jgi:hypothetical protein